MDELRIAVMGASGRMGRTLAEATLQDPSASLVAAIDQADVPVLGKDIGELIGNPCGVPISSDAEQGIARATCVIDFTRPEGTLRHLAFCRRYGVAIVIGTTGFDLAGKEAIAAASTDIPIVFAPNMSVGVNVVFKLLDTASRILSEGYDVEIFEAHHRHKIDAPSGTALRMGEVVAKGLGRSLAECAVFGRQGVTSERLGSTIGFATVRGGDIVGDHNVMFCGLGERVEIGHKASSRMPYALGSLRAAHFLLGKRRGLFDMQDVLGLR